MDNYVLIAKVFSSPDQQLQIVEIYHKIYNKSIHKVLRECPRRRLVRTSWVQFPPEALACNTTPSTWAK